MAHRRRRQFFGTGTAASGHANMGTARRQCAGFPKSQVGTCMSSYFSNQGVKCTPQAKTCKGRKR